MRSLIVLALPVLAAAQSPKPALAPDAAAFRAHVAVLADDKMRGREAGTADYDRAAAYVVAQFRAAGLLPAGDAGAFLQRVPMVAANPVDKGAVALVGPDGVAMPLAFGTEYLPVVSAAHRQVTLDAPVTFVGYGVVDPASGRDDYRGLDVKGRVVAYFVGGPKTLQGEVRAHYGANKLAAAIARGAIGAIVLETPSRAAIQPWARQVASWDSTRMSWAKPDGTGFAPYAAAPGFSLGRLGAAKLFAGAPTSFDALEVMEEGDGTMPSFALKTRIRASFANTLRPAASSNVVGLIPGSDPVLRNEYVVLSAHLDHLGVGAAVNGDRINNGALDNASGVATLIEVAKRFRKGARPKRSILLVALTGEEKGLVGSDYFARHPVRPIKAIVANVNLDMPILTYRFSDLFAAGADRSTLGPIAEAALAGMGIALSPDPDPNEALFTRSDHYRFVQQGVPALFLKTGFADGGREASIAFRRTHYHQPSDDVAKPILWDQGARFAEANYRIARAIADARERPRWNAGDFFGTLYGGHGAR